MRITVDDFTKRTSHLIGLYHEMGFTERFQWVCLILVFENTENDNILGLVCLRFLRIGFCSYKQGE